MNDAALIYEHLVCKAFKCGRFGIPFADAGVYRAANDPEKSDYLRTCILASLKVILLYQESDTSEQDLSIMKEVFKALHNDEIDADETINKLSSCIL